MPKFLDGRDTDKLLQFIRLRFFIYLALFCRMPKLGSGTCYAMRWLSNGRPLSLPSILENARPRLLKLLFLELVFYHYTAVSYARFLKQLPTTQVLLDVFELKETVHGEFSWLRNRPPSASNSYNLGRGGEQLGTIGCSTYTGPLGIAICKQQHALQQASMHWSTRLARISRSLCCQRR